MNRRVPLYVWLPVLISLPFLFVLAVNLLRPRYSGRTFANNGSALSSVKTILEGQKMFARRRASDLNGNGLPEFGFLSELAAGDESTLCIPPVLGKVDALGRARKSGYFFKIYFAEEKGKVLEEPGVAKTAENAAAFEKGFAVCAWPQDFGRGGFLVIAGDSSGRLFKKKYDEKPFAGENLPWDFACSFSGGSLALDLDKLKAEGWEEVD